MADGQSGGGGGSTAIVAIFAILVIVAGVYFAYTQGLLGGGTTKAIDVKIETPSVK